MKLFVTYPQVFTRLIYRVGALLVLLLAAFSLHAQPVVERASEGWHINPYGRIHILFVFAEMKFDSVWGNLDPEKNPAGSEGWKKGRLPFWREKIVSPSPDGDGWMTKYFREASFGKFQVTGDFLDTIVTVPISSVRDQRGNVVTQEAFASNAYRKTLIEKLNSIPKPRFHWGSTLEDFDRWGYTGQGKPNVPQSNQKTDLVMVVWRNIHVAYLADASGFVSPGTYGKIWGRDTDMHSVFHAQSFLPKVIMRHEFSHMLYGGNNFHTASGGVGTRTFMSTVGGWSNMSASDACSPAWNAWDRERLGWGNPGNRYVLSARCVDSGAEINGALKYGEELCGDGLIVLRDFVSTGDAIKIPLPHLPKGVKQQYLWLENHQCLPDFIDHDRAMVPGLYAYVQVGKDVMEGITVFGGENNYLWPLVAAGHYDFEIDSVGTTLVQDSRRANPFTGYHYLMRHTRDKNGDGRITITSDNGPKTEYDLPEHLRINGVDVHDSMFTFQNYPIFGIRTVAFHPERNWKIGMGTNPASTPVYSHSGAQAQPSDNRRIYLNGLSIQLQRIDAAGNAYIKVRWDDYEVGGDLRWCGDIVLKEKLVLKSGTEMSLAQGWSPQLPAVVQKVEGKPVFAEPTIMEWTAGSEATLRTGARIVVEAGSTLLVRKGARVQAERGARIVLKPGAFIYIEQGAEWENLSRFKTIQMEAGAQKAVNPLLSSRFVPLAPLMAF